MATAVTNQIDFAPDDPSISELVSARPAFQATPLGLTLDDAPLRRLAERTGTPVYAYGLDTIDRLRAAFDALGIAPLIAYAVKANDTGGILACLARRGAGADVVSEGELVRAVRSGIKAKDIVFSGVGKRRDEFALALGFGIRQVNIESPAELDVLSDVARQMNVTARFAVRVNPDVDAGTHAKITTGRADSKFGMSQRDAMMLARGTALPNVQFVGFSVHIGSQITDITPFRAAFRAVAAMARTILAEGHDLRSLDLGGGIGISYRPGPSVSVESYADAVVSELGELARKVDIIIEPGRWIVGPSGILVTRVILEKENDGRRFVVVDAGMNDLMRPAMYGAWHGIVPVDCAVNTGLLSEAGVVGPVCESSDTFGKARLLPKFSPGDLVAILDAGAYGSVMSSTYNNRPAAAIALASRGEWVVARRRQTLDELMADDLSIPLVKEVD
ncbi:MULTISPECIES: diaminopimelate decarboxylase [Bradyrhizobium]|uniref:Diaminopimelate decarboxylase n=2 Tax=Bradyrhizobium TaxID=374 RepID=A0ABY0PM46_9BRAD|nr:MULTISPECIES: diaminopimelate decarboxylase [Bradyrhizobium]SDI63045.1 diaminopimelate decarboxylase [Bradyrhizobium ottawaense]SED34594.1 diaminopimelate decarboxylase [Bradyrhizobium lablabi]